MRAKVADVNLVRTLSYALGIAVGVASMEFVGGLTTNSLALLGDAGHMSADSLALLLSLLALLMAQKPHTSSLTFGYHRVEVFAAFVNGVSLFSVSIILFYESYRRIFNPPEVKGPLLLLFASIGLLANIIMILMLRKGKGLSLNVKGAFLHVLGDTLSSIGVIAGGFLVTVTKENLIDPLVGALIGVLVLRSSLGLLKESGRVLLEATPSHISFQGLIQTIRKVEGVRDIHDLHVWTITSQFHVLSGHLVVDDQKVSKTEIIIRKIQEVLRERFSIEHTAFQLEVKGPSLVEIKADKGEENP